MDVTLGHDEDLIMFCDLALVFKVTVKHVCVCLCVCVCVCVCRGGGLTSVKSLKTILLVYIPQEVVKYTCYNLEIALVRS